MNCCEFFEDPNNADAKCEKLRTSHAIFALQWEGDSASSYSPGPVADQERLVRTMFNPIHLDFDGGKVKLKPGALMDAKDKGLSVDRNSYTSLDDIKARGLAKVAKDNAAGKSNGQRSLGGLASVPCCDIRAIQSADGVRWAAVYDTALPENNAHADICIIAKDVPSQRKAVSVLMDLCNEALEQFELR